MMDTQFQAIIPSPIGYIGIQTQGDYLISLTLLPMSGHTLRKPNDYFTLEVTAQINAYFVNPKFIFNIPVALNGTPFQKRVWANIQKVPSGAVSSYGELSSTLNSGPRAVANACAMNCLLLIIPCHRIVAKNGLGGFSGNRLGNYEDNLHIKRWLLKHEQSL